LIYRNLSSSDSTSEDDPDEESDSFFREMNPQITHLMTLNHIPIAHRPFGHICSMISQISCSKIEISRFFRRHGPHGQPLKCGLTAGLHISSKIRDSWRDAADNLRRLRSKWNLGIPLLDPSLTTRTRIWG
jgi:hypothetical protein